MCRIGVFKRDRGSDVAESRFINYGWRKCAGHSDAVKARVIGRVVKAIESPDARTNVDEVVAFGRLLRPDPSIKDL